MTKQRAPFMPVTPDIDDDALENLARDKGVGALIKPVAAREGEGASGPSSPDPAPTSAPAKAVTLPPTQEAASAPASASGATPRSRMKSLNIELPDYAWTDLKIRAVREQVSVRHIIMSALKEQGIEISEADMIEDGRRLRN